MCGGTENVYLWYLFILGSLIELAKELSKDPKSLSKLKMHRTTVSYKFQYGLANTFRVELTERLRTTTYSVNLDEATSKNLMHVLIVLVSYFDRSAKKVKVEQLPSLNVPAVDASALYAEVYALQKSYRGKICGHANGLDLCNERSQKWT